MEEEHPTVTQQSIQPLEFYLRPGFLVAHDGDAVVKCILGSAVAVALYDRLARIGGISHFVWPHAKDRRRSNVTYGDTAIPMLRKTLEDMGCHRTRLEAMVFGGACPRQQFSKSDASLGQENITLTRAILKRMNIPLVSEDVGGCRGRKILYHTRSNDAVILKVDTLRPWDWYERDSTIPWDRV